MRNIPGELCALVARLRMGRFFYLCVNLAGIGAFPIYAGPEPRGCIDTLASEYHPIDPSKLASAGHFDRAYFRRTNAYLSDAEFSAKWDKVSKKSAFTLFRSFPYTFYAELRGVAAGPTGLCFGDPHPENFGFELFYGGMRYVFNDLDDSGHCPVGLDALRYFTAVQIFENDRTLLKTLASYYLTEVGRRGPRNPPATLPSLDYFKLHADELNELTAGDRLRYQDTLHPMEPTTREAAFAEMKKLPGLADARILDAQRMKPKKGGSAGVDRLWFFLEIPTDVGRIREVVELKPLLDPATGAWEKDPAERIRKLTAAFWPNLRPLFYEVVTVGADHYVLRSRTRQTPKLKSLEVGERPELYRRQLEIIADQHRPIYGPGATPSEAWLIAGATTLAEHYRGVAKVAGKTAKE